MARKVKHRFEEDRKSPEMLAELREHFIPGGSGPLSTMRTVVEFIEAFAEEKGWDLDKYTKERV